MGKRISIIIVFLMISGRLLSQQKVGDAPVDFFKEPKKLLGWSGPLSGSFKLNKNIAAAPLFQYFDYKVGSARIICAPNFGFEKWEALMKKHRPNERRLVDQIASNKLEQKKYTIHAFFMDKKYLVPPTEKPYFPNEKEMEFPAPIIVYKKVGDTWKQLTKVDVKTWSEYADLQMKYVSGK